jgi:hypothetical protein
MNLAIQIISVEFRLRNSSKICMLPSDPQVINKGYSSVKLRQLIA